MDSEDVMDQTQRKSGSLNYIIFIAFCIIMAVFTYIHPITLTHAKSNAIVLPPETKIVPLLPAPAKTAITPPVQKQEQEQTYTIRRGETLADIFYRAGLPPTLWMTILKSQTATHYLEHLQEKQSIAITTDAQHHFVSLTYQPNFTKTLIVSLRGSEPQATIKEKPVTKTVQFKSTVIHHSLVGAEKATGLPTALQHELNQMLVAGALNRYIRPGDRLNILYHEYFVGGRKEKTGNIVAAEITNGTTDHRIVRFTAPNHKTGIYKTNGQGTQAAFLRVPVLYRRIGSYFTYHRMDPIIHKMRPHLGVDLDAPEGTPVKAIGNGVVISCNQVRGYGNVVMIRYNKTYKTLYAHLEKFAAHLHPNEPVKKGQIVGYVGSTGWSTGPHLHYSLYKNGVPVNPLTATLPTGNGVPERYRRDFIYKENHWFNEMKLFEQEKTPGK